MIVGTKKSLLPAPASSLNLNLAFAYEFLVSAATFLPRDSAA